MKRKLAYLGTTLFFLFLILTRFLHLPLIPATLTHDEVVYAIQAKSYALQGTSLARDQRPWDIKPIHPQYAEWPATIMLPGFLLFEDAQLATHFSSAMIGVVLPFVFGWLLWGLWKNKQLAIIGALIVGVNPLLWQFGRLSYDAFYSTFFYLAGAAVWVNLDNKKKLWSLPLFVIGFFQYQGLKVLLLPWMTLIFILERLKQRGLNRISAWIVVFGLLLTLFYGLVLLPKFETHNRLGNNIFKDNAFLAETVDTERRLSLDSRFQKLASNKGTAISQFMTDRLIGAYNPWLLFVRGEPNSTGFAVWTHGILYLLDAVLIFSGIIYLFSQKKTRLTGVVLLVFVVVFTLPNLINTVSEWHMLRSFLGYTTLIFLSSWGFYWLWQQRWLRWPLVILYGLSVLNFSYQYFYRYPITNLDAGTFDEKIAAHYVELTQASTDKSIVIHTATPEMTFYNYLLYEEKLNREKLDEIHQTVIQNQDQPTRKYSLGNLTVTNDCVDVDADQVTLWQTGHSFCRVDESSADLSPNQEAFQAERLTIPAVLDSGEAYRLQNDVVCGSTELKSYAHLQELKQLDFNHMSVEEFCYNWITDLRELNS